MQTSISRFWNLSLFIKLKFLSLEFQVVIIWCGRKNSHGTKDSSSCRGLGWVFFFFFFFLLSRNSSLKYLSFTLIIFPRQLGTQVSKIRFFFSLNSSLQGLRYWFAKIFHEIIATRVISVFLFLFFGFFFFQLLFYLSQNQVQKMNTHFQKWKQNTINNFSLYPSIQLKWNKKKEKNQKTKTKTLK